MCNLANDMFACTTVVLEFSNSLIGSSPRTNSFAPIRNSSTSINSLTRDNKLTINAVLMEIMFGSSRCKSLGFFFWLNGRRLLLDANSTGALGLQSCAS